MKHSRIIAVLAFLIMMAGCSSKSVQYEVPITVEGTIFFGEADKKMSLELRYDDAWITRDDNHEYNNELSAFATILCLDSYFRTKDIERGTVSRVLIDGDEEGYDQQALLERLGFSDVQIIDTYKAKDYPKDSNDSALITMAHKVVDGRYDAFIIVFRGCYSIGERLSIFDVGSDSDDYFELTGSHEEWLDRNICKGLDVSCGRALEYIRSYISEHDDPSYENTIFMTGHSRGGMLANVIGAILEDEKELKTYTYTFNSCPTVKDEDAFRYSSIFNIFDIHDYYADPLPFRNEHFVRYGKDMAFNIKEDEEILQKLAEIRGDDGYICLGEEQKERYDRLFGDLFPDRDGIYLLEEHLDSFATAEEASDHYLILQELADGMGLGDLYELELVSEEGIVNRRYCKAALLLAYADIQAYGQSAYDAAAILFKDEEEGMAIADIIYENLAEISADHYIINDYAISLCTK